MSKPKQRLLEEIKADRLVSGRVPLLIQLVSTMSDEERKDLLDAINDITISSAAISRALKKRGYMISASAIGQYRRGEIVHELA